MHVILSFSIFSDVNLSVIDDYKIQFPDISIGYSGHELGFIPTLGAVAKGVKVIERHFTLDKSLKGSDHKCSLDPEEFEEMVRSIRTMEVALGNPRKSFLNCIMLIKVVENLHFLYILIELQKY